MNDPRPTLEARVALLEATLDAIRDAILDLDRRAIPEVLAPAAR